jgi:hypothetical protein
MKFKAHNCKVIDTNKAMVLAPDGKSFVVRTGGMKQTVVYRKLSNDIRRRSFVK